MQTDNKPPLLLPYVVTPKPDPLVPGLKEEVVISLQDNAYYCDMIQISIPCGDDPADVFATPPPKPSLNISNNHWSSGDPKPIHDTEGGPHYYQWTINNMEENLKAMAADFTFTGVVNKIGGKPQVIIDEDSGTNPTELTEREGSFPVAKSSQPLFYLQNLVAIDYLSPEYPCGAFPLGYSIELSWEGSSGATYDLYQSGISDPLCSGTTATNYTLGKGITDTTTFCCVASNGKGDKLFQCLTLTVTNPAIAAQNMTTANTEKILGDMTTSGQASCKTLTLSNNPTNIAAAGPGINTLISDSATFNLNDNFEVDGDATFTGTLTCTDINTDDLTIQDSLAFNGQQESIFGPPVLVTTGVDIGFGIVPAVSDGYAVITVSGPSIPIIESAAYGALGIVDMLEWVYTYGGNSGLPYLSETDGFLMLPVPSGASWEYQGANLIVAAAFCTISVYWFPVGKAGSEQSVGIEIPPERMKAMSDDKHYARVHFEQYLAAKRKRRGELITSMETMLETTFDEAIKEDMFQQLMKL